MPNGSRCRAAGTSTIAAALDHGYSPSSLNRRLLAGGLLVAVEPAGRLVGFAETGVDDERIAWSGKVQGNSVGHVRDGSGARFRRRNVQG